jgi:hypothetical protein
MSAPEIQSPNAGTVADGNAWLRECNPAEWLLKEYELLTTHYYHEDSEFKKTINLFSLLQVSLLGFATSEFISKDPRIWLPVHLVGVVLAIAWFGAMVKVREFRDYFEARLEAVENALHDAWGHSGFTPLDLRTSKGWRVPRAGEFALYSYFRRAAAAKIYFALPICFGVIWLVLAVTRGFVKG